MKMLQVIMILMMVGIVIPTEQIFAEQVDQIDMIRQKVAEQKKAAKVAAKEKAKVLQEKRAASKKSSKAVPEKKSNDSDDKKSLDISDKSSEKKIVSEVVAQFVE